MTLHEIVEVIGWCVVEAPVAVLIGIAARPKTRRLGEWR